MHKRTAFTAHPIVLQANTLCYIVHFGIWGRAITRVFKNNWFERFARKERLSDTALIDAIVRAESGLVDADLGGGVVKQRVARAGQGKPGGYRTLILFRHGDRAIFAFGFAKSRQDNISQADLAILREAATQSLGWSDDDMDRLVKSGALMEIEHGQDDER